MRTMIKTLNRCLLAIAFSCGLEGCSNNYLTDGGISSPYYDGTVWEYLNSRPDCFAQLVEVIDYAGMKDVFEKDEITFFAPTDFSIRRSMDYLSGMWYKLGNDSIKSYKQVKPEVWKYFLSMYVVKDKYLLNDIPQIDTLAVSAYPGQAYVSYGGRPMNIGVSYGSANGVKYAGYRQLIYSYVFDFTAMDMKNAQVATCNIQPKNGVVHVIKFTNHPFGFDLQLFVSYAFQAGILKESEVGNQQNLKTM